jgi:hypothetical protein
MRRRIGLETGQLMIIKLLDESGTSEARANAYIDQQFAYVTRNTGNLLFLHALKKQIPQAISAHWSDFEHDTDVIVLALANFINPNSNLSTVLPIIRASTATRIVLVSCGAQAASYDDQFELQPNMREFLSIVSERSTSIGVRGVYTAELLYRNGFKNLRIIGCPSVFLAGAQPPIIRQSCQPVKIAIGVQPYGDFLGHIRDLYTFGMRTDATYFLQAESHLAGLFTDEPTTEHRKNLDYFKTHYCPSGVEPELFAYWLKERASIFFDVQPWIARMREFDLCVNGRFHGSVAAIQGGCPTLTIASDSRTRELCEYFYLPFIDLARFDATKPAEHYASLVDYTNFYATYPARLAEYVEFMDENGISVFGLAEGPQTKISERTELPDLGHLPIGRATQIRTAIRSIEDARIGPAFSALRAALAQERVP